MTGPLLMWLLVQLLALLVAAFRVPLAAGYRQPGDLLAAHVMVVAQVTIAALVFPYLMRSGPAAIAVVCSAWPLVVIAGVLSGTPTAGIVAAAGYVTAWLLALGALNAALPERFRPLGVATVTLLSVGVLIVLYLDVEFGGGNGVWKSLSPPLAALRQVSGDASARDWLLPATAATVATAVAFLRRRSRQVIHKL